MRTIIPLAVAASLISTAAIAQTTTDTPTMPAPSATAPSATTAAGEQPGTSLTMTDDQAKAWVNKTVYSSDAKNVGEVGVIQRDSSGKVTELQADIGGFLGLGETRVRVEPNQFKVVGDRIVLDMTADQVKQLPKIAK